MTTSFRALALGLAFALTVTACDSGTDPGTGGSVAATGTLNNSFGAPIEGATMTFASGAARGSASLPTYTATSGANGAFSLNIPPGTYTLTIGHPNYSGPGTTVTVTVSASGQVTVQTPITGSGIIETIVVNALNGQGVPNATLACYIGTTTTGVAAFSLTSDADGNVRSTGTPTGSLTCAASLSGTVIATFPLTVATTGTTTAPPVTFVPLPSTGEFRVVLTWGTSPSDLDSHVTGPGSQGGRFHIYYSSPSAPFANLDLDDTSGSGPETVTITATAAAAQGMYRYSVHNYSDQSGGGAAGIAGSPAVVRVYGPTGLLKTYTAPPVGASTGNTWRVFELTVQGTSFTLNDNNGASLGYVTASSSGDSGTFLTGGSGETPMPKGLTL